MIIDGPYIDDDELYNIYPQHRKWFNKLYLSEQMGYKCAPAGIAPDEDGTYVVRPIMNLAGMGIGATVKEIKAGDVTKVPAGYFWCEYFNGTHYSCTYKWEYNRDSINGEWKTPWKGAACWEGINMPINLSKFVEWKRSTYIPKVPDILVCLRDIKVINVEFIDDKPIEVHLRDSPNPNYDHLIPVWASDFGAKKEHMELHGYKFIEAYSNANGQLEDPRIGFLVK